jgi:hypothetical protein
VLRVLLASLTSLTPQAWLVQPLRMDFDSLRHEGITCAAQETHVLQLMTRLPDYSSSSTVTVILGVITGGSWGMCR